ncbi:MAG: nuclear transport factor 2 family protein [Pseudomonadota bacterium]|nr:nuclear transport factor 2 family protein [Pseudomonadota bacterium]
MKIDGTRSNDRATEVVLAYLAAMNRADWAAVLGLVADDVIHDFDGGTREIGKAAFAAGLRDRAAHREQLTEVVVMSSPDGARAAVEYLARGEAESTNAAVALGTTENRYPRPGGLFFGVRDGLIERVSNYQGRPEPDPASSGGPTQ